MDKLLRLDKYLADTGRWSRKEAKLLLKSGRVCVDGVTERAPERKVSPAEHAVTVDGAAVVWAKYRYFMLNKPAGVLTATEDRHQRTVLDLLAPEDRDVFPVGRLDKDTEGLLLLTDDGELAHRLLSPKYHVDKVYEAETDGTVDADDIRAFAEGLTLEDGTQCMSAGLQALGEGKCLVTLHEGKYHQVKRMLAHCGKPVLHLKRLSMGELRLDGTLAPGAYRPLTEREVSGLKPEE